MSIIHITCIHQLFKNLITCANNVYLHCLMVIYNESTIYKTFVEHVEYGNVDRSAWKWVLKLEKVYKEVLLYNIEYIFKEARRSGSVVWSISL